MQLIGGGATLLASAGPIDAQPGQASGIATDPAKQSEEAAGSNEFGIDNPYADIDWKKVTYTTSTTHVHVETQEKLDLYYQNGLRHFAISNYYPSAPTYPIKSIRYNQYKVEQDFGLVYNADSTKTGNARWAAGQFLPGPFRWNDIIMKGPRAWAEELPADLRATLPFELGDFIFKNVPEDIIVSPNAEHHGFINSSLHACAVGSMYSSGNFDDFYRTQEHGYARGTGLLWEVAFKKMIDQMLYPDAGGITINHPVSSQLAVGEITKMLDFDPRVLGIEVYNDGDVYSRHMHAPPLALDLWDEILRTGRRCLGFFVPDHTVARGKNVLLVPSFTEHECLNAYRKGAFIGTMIGTGLQFTRISLENNHLTVALNAPANLRFITDKGLALENKRNHFVREMDYQIATGPDGHPTISYIRVEVIDYTSTEQLFSQPIRFLRKRV